MGALLAAVVVASAAHAQAPPPASLQSSPIPSIAPVAPPRVSPGATDLQLGPLDNKAPDQPIAVRSVSVIGASLYQAEIEAMAGGLVGSAVSLRQIEAARLAMVKKYRDGGYPLTSVQATRSRDGTLRFQVYEGHIVDVKLDGDDIGPAGVQVLRFLNRLLDERPVSVRGMERWLLLAQDVPGVSVQAVLKPSETDPGALTLVATVKRSMFSGMYTADNRAYQLTGPEQGLGVLQANSFTSWGERTELSLYHTFNATQLFGQGAFEFFAGSSGLKVRLYAGAGNVNPSGFLRSLGYNGTTTVAGASTSYPVIRSREQTLNVVGAFDAIDSVITTATTGTQRTPTSKDSLRVFRLGADYGLRDIFLGDARPAINAATIRVSKGISGLGATHGTTLGTTATPARVGEKIDFAKLSGEVSRNQTLFSPWAGASVGIMGLVTGQFSKDVLPPAEKFYLGGSRFTRGFYSGQASGDNAVAATAELQLNTSNEVSLFGTSYDINTQYYAFYDYGYAWQNLSTDPNKIMNSFGVGARIQLTPNVEIDLETVRRLTRGVDGQAASQLKDYGFYWRVLTRF